MNTTPINPYKPGPPVREKDFYDRKALLDKVFNDLKSSNAILLQGQRRIGKTSFLHRLHDFLMEGAGSTESLPLIFDMQIYVDDTLPQFQEHLAGEIAKKLNMPYPRSAEFESDPTLFQETWLPQVFNHLGNRQLVILVDEFDNLGELKEGRAVEELVPFIGNLVENEDRLKWVFTVGRHIDKLPMHYDQIILTAEKHVIKRLTREETEELICEPASRYLTFQPEAIDQIFQMTSGQPHLTQALCWKVFGRVTSDEGRHVVTPEDVEAVISSTLETYKDALSSIAQVPAIEKPVLLAVAQLTGEKQPASRQSIIQFLEEHRIPLERGELDDALKHLKDWDLLAQENQMWQLTVELVRLWVEKNISLERDADEERDLRQARADRRFNLAETAYKEANYAVAIQDYKEALRYKPDHQKALRGLADSYQKTGSLAGRASSLQKLYRLDQTVFPEMVEALENYAQECETEGKHTEAIEQYKNLIRIQRRHPWEIGLVQACLEEADKHLEETRKPVVNKIYPLSEARRVIEDGLTAVFRGPESEKLRKKLEEIEHRKKEIEHDEWVASKFKDADKAEEKENWKEVALIYQDLLGDGTNLTEKQERTLQKATWKSLYNENSFFYQIPLMRGPTWLKSMVGSVAGLIETAILMDIIDIDAWGASIYALLIALNIGLVKALGRQRATNILAVHFIVGGVVAGLFKVITSFEGVHLFLPLVENGSLFIFESLRAYILLIVVVATPLALVVFLEMSFTHGKVRTGIVNSIYTLIGGVVCALIGGVLGIWLSIPGMLPLPLAAYLSLGVSWILVSLIMDIGDPATYGVNPDDTKFVFRR